MDIQEIISDIEKDCELNKEILLAMIKLNENLESFASTMKYRKETDENYLYRYRLKLEEEK